MCFAMREGIIDQQSDVCGDVETNVNEARTPANPLSFFHVPSSPLDRYLLSSHIPSTTDSTFISYSLDISLSFRIPRMRPFIYTYIDVLYSTPHIHADVCMRSTYCIYYSYILRKMPKQAHTSV